jgi:hypothetical protein
MWDGKYRIDADAPERLTDLLMMHRLRISMYAINASSEKWVRHLNMGLTILSFMSLGT